LTKHNSSSGRGAARAVVLLGVLATLTLGFAPAADASWGKEKCSSETHCYAIAEWAMTGGTESVRGAEDVPTTNVFNAQEWESGGFVDDELWVSFPNKSGGWLESGQTAGWTALGRTDCCTSHPFIALSLNSSGYGYEEYVWITVNAEPTNVYSIQDPSANGVWCFYINGTNQGCKSKPSYWAEYSSNVKAGIEASSHYQTPENSGSQQVNATARNGAVKEWKGALTQAALKVQNAKRESIAGVMCIGPNTKSNFYGNAIWSICG
jgi:hypothetical protein